MTGETFTAKLGPGARVRHRRHPELTGRIKCLEWQRPGVLSAIPYNIAWDDSARAIDVLGWFWIYQGDDTVEPMDGEAPTDEGERGRR